MTLFLSLCFLLLEDEGKPNVEVIILVCTGAAATFLWLMLILFIRKLRKVGRLFFFPQKPNQVTLYLGNYLGGSLR